MADDLAQCRALLAQARTERARRVLRKELLALEDEHRTALSENIADKPSRSQPAAGDNRITSYAWDQTGKFVKLYVSMDGVGQLPDDSIACEFESHAFGLTVRKPGEKDRVLHVRPLFDEIDPEKSTYAVKTDRILIKLAKKVPDTEWGSVDDAKRKAEAAKSDKMKQNEGKSTAQLLSEMYRDADDDAKKKLEEAWEKGR
eukprot:CAMPEP_0119406930 /NCGR_PEP_ID=MMETSP1335-20130426/1063_1 /TAXON_ID=259385 /ORGANISM="Chrysoculter rhomboideus, Strain RCC1486" /LENGTH=200 /DNA_ID=CAMNT_0007431023 /DNA_START=19 /DNA_END=618 /DNA_ORIENTATION=-